MSCPGVICPVIGAKRPCALSLVVPVAVHDTGTGVLPPIGYQPVVPGPPLNGPVTTEVIQPP